LDQKWPKSSKKIGPIATTSFAAKVHEEKKERTKAGTLRGRPPGQASADRFNFWRERFEKTEIRLKPAFSQ
jgi:hypothetical protein